MVARAAVRVLYSAAVAAALQPAAAAPAEQGTWRLTLHPPVIVAGHINATRLRAEDSVQPFDNTLGIPCIFFGMEWPYAKSIWSSEQYYALDNYSEPSTNLHTSDTGMEALQAASSSRRGTPRGHQGGG